MAVALAMRGVTLVNRPIKFAGVLAHRLRHLLPLGLLGGSDLELGAQLRDVLLDRTITFRI